MDDRNQLGNTPNASRISRIAHRARIWRLPLLVAGLTAAAFITGAHWHPTDAADSAKQNPGSDPKYAQVFLELAEAQLAYAERMNRQSSGTFSRDQVAQFQRSIDLWNDLLAREKKSGQFDRIAAMQGLAQLRLLRTQSAIANAESVNQRVPGTFPDERLKELRAFVALAQLDANAGRSIESATPTEQLLWRIEVLEDEMMILRKEVERNRRTQQ